MRRWRRLAMVCALFLVAAACGGDDDETAETADTVAGSTSSSAADEAPEDEAPEDEAPEASSTTVAVADSPLGEILVDGEGNTLYLFTNDSGGTSSCSGGCADTWPPLVVDGEPTAGEGIDEAELGTTTRDDGTEQVTYAGSPLYLFASDEAPGDTNGQGVGGVWFVVSPDGAAIEETAAAELAPQY